MVTNPYLITGEDYRKIELMPNGRIALLKPNQCYDGKIEKNFWYIQGRQYSQKGLEKFIELNPDIKLIMDNEEIKILRLS